LGYAKNPVELLDDWSTLMTSKRQAALLFISLFMAAATLHAQTESTTHIFPQIVDGVQSDGSVFTSRIWIGSIGGLAPSCNVSVFGFGQERLTATGSVTIQPASWTAISTRGQGPIATGYARLDCSQPVFASITYRLQTRDGVTLGTTTALRAPTTSHALIPMLPNNRYGIAIANDNDEPLNAALFFSSSGVSRVVPIQVPARSQYVKFADEIFQINGADAGSLEILANGSPGSSGSFNIMALVFDQTAFTTVLPAVID
jgi:hypothetical protein